MNSSGWDWTFGRFDHFRWSFYNLDGQRLFAIDFDNNVGERIYYMLGNSSTFYNTGRRFYNDATHLLEVYMFFSENFWFADLDGSSLTGLLPISSTGAALNLRDVAAVWSLSNVNSPGNNYMAFDNYSIDLFTALTPPVIRHSTPHQSVTSGSTVQLSVSATGTPPLYYQWYFNDAPISGATGTNLFIPNITTNQAGMYHVTVSNLVGVTRNDGSMVVVAPYVAPPPNDHFAARTAIPDFPSTIRGYNTAATREAGEPLHAGNRGGRSVWWTWTAPHNGRVTFSTVGSDFDTILAVYQGHTLSSLTLVAANDDAQNHLRGSWITFPAIAGTTYQIAVDGYYGDAGTILLTIKPDASARAVDLHLSPENGFGFALAGEQGLKFTIQSSTNLRDWTTLTNLLNWGGTFNFSDPSSLNSPRKFYRIVQE